jgi:cell division protein FtsL
MNVLAPLTSPAAPVPLARRRRPAGPSPAAARVARLAVPVALLASVALFHVYTHVRVTSAGYAIGRLEAEHRRLLAERDRLKLEVATLRAPGRLERFARAQLGMAPPAAGTVVSGRAGVAAAGRSVRAGGETARRAGPAEPGSEAARLALGRGAPGAR